MTPEELDRAVARAVAQAVEQGFPERITDPVVLAPIAEILLDAYSKGGPAPEPRRAARGGAHGARHRPPAV